MPALRSEMLGDVQTQASARGVVMVQDSRAFGLPVEIIPVEQKVWGTVQHVFVSKHAAVSFLTVNEGFRCSRHYHRYRANQFTVLEGIVLVETFYPGLGGRLLDVVKLVPGSTLIVPSRETHRFRVLKSGRMIEVYFPDTNGIVSIEDIVRFDEGGPDAP